MITPEFDSIYYEVIFKVDGKIVRKSEVSYGDMINYPDDPKKEGYKFVGWDYEEDVVTEDKVINAIFAIDTYNVEYYVGGVKFERFTGTYDTINGAELPILVGEGYTYGYLAKKVKEKNGEGYDSVFIADDGKYLSHHTTQEILKLSARTAAIKKLGEKL